MYEYKIVYSQQYKNDKIQIKKVAESLGRKAIVASPAEIILYFANKEAEQRWRLVSVVPKDPIRGELIAYFERSKNK